MNKFNSQTCTTKEQSQRLLKLGLKPETADMSLSVVYGEELCQWVGAMKNMGTVTFNGKEVPNEEIESIPAWSLHRLLCIASESYLSMNFNVKKSDLYSDIIAIIEKLIKKGKVNKEYLKGDTE